MFLKIVKKMTKTKTIAGVDWSLNCPALCVLADDLTFANSAFFFLTHRKRDIEAKTTNIIAELHAEYNTEQERYDNASGRFIKYIDALAQHPIVWLEGYAMGSKGLVFNIAESTGLLKHKLHLLGIRVNIVPPTTVKKFATGKGNSDKTAMYKAFLDRDKNPDLMRTYYIKDDAKIGSPVTDIVDAYFIALYGYNQTYPRP